MTSGQKYPHLKGCFFLQNGITEKYFEKEGGGTTQFIKVETCLQKSYILLPPGFLTFTLHMSNRQEVQKHKGNQYENCESLLINQLTQTLQVRGFYKHFN